MKILICEPTAVNGVAAYVGDIVETDPASAAAAIAARKAGMGGAAPAFDGPVQVVIARATVLGPGEALMEPGTRTVTPAVAARLWGRSGCFFPDGGE